MSKVHELKTLGTVWDAVQRGEKTFEVRKNDRFFQKGDTVILRRINDEYPHSYTRKDGRCLDLIFAIGWMLQGGQFGLEPGYCIFQLEPKEEGR